MSAWLSDTLLDPDTHPDPDPKSEDTHASSLNELLAKDILFRAVYMCLC